MMQLYLKGFSVSVEEVIQGDNIVENVWNFNIKFSKGLKDFKCDL